MLEHGDDGGLGVVLNRSSETSLDDVFPEWRELASPPEGVFIGGPVATDAVIALARRRAVDVDGFVPIVGDLGTVDLTEDPLRIGASLATLRVFAGYAGWGSGQLEAELEQGAWFVVPLDPDDPFTGNPGTAVARRVAAPTRPPRPVRELPRGRDGQLMRVASDSVPVGAVRAVEVGAGEFVVWRGADGRVRSAPRWCPHLDHDLADGYVNGSELVCAGHAWAFDGAGNTYKRNELGRVDPKGSVPVLAIVETGGTIDLDLG